jgi:hypothetical protein
MHGREIKLINILVGSSARKYSLGGRSLDVRMILKWTEQNNYSASAYVGSKNGHTSFFIRTDWYKDSAVLLNGPNTKADQQRRAAMLTTKLTALICKLIRIGYVRRIGPWPSCGVVYPHRLHCKRPACHYIVHGVQKVKYSWLTLYLTWCKVAGSNPGKVVTFSIYLTLGAALWP